VSESLTHSHLLFLEGPLPLKTQKCRSSSNFAGPTTIYWLVLAGAVPANKELLDGIVPAYKELLAGTVPANKELLAGTIPANKELLAGTVPANKELLAGRVPANNLFQNDYLINIISESSKMKRQSKTRSSKRWMELLGNDDFKIGKKKNNLRLRLEALNGEEDIVPEFDPGEGPSGLSVGRGPVDWARDKLQCCREDAIMLVTAKEVTFTICAFQMIFMEEASGGLEIPALKEVGFPGVGMFFRFGNSIFLQLKIGDTVPAMSRLTGRSRTHSS
jgi:hypothetical protein